MKLLNGHVRWVLVVWMLVISAVSYLDRVNVSIAGPSIEREFQLDHIHLGWVFSAWVLGYALFRAPSGRLADRFGPRKILLLGTVWWAVFTGLTALVPGNVAGSLVTLVAVRFLLGVGESIVYPATNRLVAAWVPTQERGLANGLIFAGVGLGAAVTPPLIAYIIYHYGWRVSLWVCAFIGLVIGALWFLMARDEPEQHPWVGPKELSYISAGLPHKNTNSATGALPWRAILGSKNVWIITASYFGFVYVAYIFFTWFFTYLNTVQRTVNLKASAGYAILPFAAMAACSSMGGFVRERSSDEALRKAYWTLYFRVGIYGYRGGFRRTGNACCRSEGGEHCGARRGSGRTLPGKEDASGRSVRISGDILRGRYPES